MVFFFLVFYWICVISKQEKIWIGNSFLKEVKNEPNFPLIKNNAYILDGL
jgi:hypothetical protein